MAEGQIEEKKVKTGWDYLKSGLKFAKDLVVDVLRAFPRAAVGLGVDIADILQKGRLTGKPEYPQKFGKLGEIILGKEPILPPSAYFRKGGEIGSKTSRFLKEEWGIDIPEPIAKRIGEVGGLTFFALDLIPIIPGKSLVSKSVLKTLAKETNENIIKDVLKREIPQLTDEVVEKIAPQIAKAQKSKDVLRVLRSGFKESEALKGVAPRAKEVAEEVKIPKELKPLADEARKSKSAEEFIKKYEKIVTPHGYVKRGIEDAIELRREGLSLAKYSKLEQEEWFGKNTRLVTPIPKDGKITLYRATPTGEPIRPGDYVTESLEYAKEHLRFVLGGKGKISKIEATLDDIFPADAPHEFWYAPKWVEKFSPENWRNELIDFYNQVVGKTKKSMIALEKSASKIVEGKPTRPSVSPPEPPKKPPVGTSFPNDDIARFISQPKEKRVMSSLWQNVLKKGVMDETTLREVLGEEAGTYLRRNRVEFWNQLENKLERAGFKNIEQLYKMIMNDWRSVRNKVTGERIKFEQDELEMLGIKLFKHFVDNKEWVRASKLAEKLTIMAVKAGRGVEIYRAVPEAIRIQLKPFVLKNQILDYASKYNIELSEKAMKELDKITQDFMEKSTQMGYKEFEKYLSDTIFEFAKKHLPPLSWKERFDIIRTGGVLFNPWSAYRNAFSNAFQAFVLKPATLTTQVLIDYLRSLRNPDIEKVTLSNVASYYKSMLGSLGFAFDSFLEVMRRGVSSEKMLETMTKEGIEKIIEMGRYAGTNDFLTRVSKWPLNFLEATDIFFAALIKEGEKMRLIDMYKQAGKKITPRLLEELEEKAGEVAAKFLFREKLGQREKLKELGPLAQLFDVLGDHLLQLKNRMKTVSPVAYYAFSPFVLFVRTPINIAKLMLEYSPDILFASSKTSESYAKALLGSMAMGIGAWFAFNGRTTFLPPSNPTEKELWYSAGNKPFSIRLPGLELNVPVWYFGPLALPLIIPAAATWATKELKVDPDKKTEQQIIAATLGILRFIGEQTSLTGLNSFFKTLAGEVDYTLSQTLTFTGSQFIPLSGLWKAINRVLDPIYRQAGKDIPDSLKKEFSAYYKLYLEAIGKSPEEIEKLMPQSYLRLTPEGTIEPSRREWWQMMFPWEPGKFVPELQQEYEREVEQRQLRTEARELIPREIREKRKKKERQMEARALFIYSQNRSIPKEERIKVIEEKLAENPEIEEEFMNLLEEERLRKILPPTIPPEIKRWSPEEKAYFIDAWMKKQRQVGVSKQEILNVLEVLQDEGILTDEVIDILYELKHRSPVNQEKQ